MILSRSNDDICFIYYRKCEDMMFCDLNFFLMKYLILVSSALSMRIIAYTVQPLSTGIIIDFYLPW